MHRQCTCRGCTTTKQASLKRRKSCVGQVNSLEGVWCRSLTPVPTTRTSLRRVASRCERLRRLRRLRAVAAGCEPLRAIASHCSHCEPLRAIASGWSGRGRLQTALHTRPGCALVLCDDWTPLAPPLTLSHLSSPRDRRCEYLRFPAWEVKTPRHRAG